MVVDEDKYWDSPHDERLKRLHHWLTLEGSSVLFFIAGIHLPLGIVVKVLSVFAIAFTPYLLMTLWKLRHPVWIGGFCVFVGVPFVLQFVFRDAMVVSLLIRLLALFFFYAFCWTLRFRVEEWLELPNKVPSKRL